MVNTIPAPLALGVAVTVRDSEEWKTGSCKRAFPMSASDVAVVSRAEKIQNLYLCKIFMVIKKFLCRRTRIWV